MGVACLWTRNSAGEEAGVSLGRSHRGVQGGPPGRRQQVCMGHQWTTYVQDYRVAIWSGGDQIAMDLSFYD